MIAAVSVMHMKRNLCVFSSVLLSTVGLLTVPVGLVAFAFSTVDGIVLIVIGGLTLGIAIAIGRQIDQPRTRRHP
jgi:hypothetical protein